MGSRDRDNATLRFRHCRGYHVSTIKSTPPPPVFFARMANNSKLHYDRAIAGLVRSVATGGEGRRASHRRRRRHRHHHRCRCPPFPPENERHQQRARTKTTRASHVDQLVSATSIFISTITTTTTITITTTTRTTRPPAARWVTARWVRVRGGGYPAEQPPQLVSTLPLLVRMVTIKPSGSEDKNEER